MAATVAVQEVLMRNETTPLPGNRCIAERLRRLADAVESAQHPLAAKQESALGEPSFVEIRVGAGGSLSSSGFAPRSLAIFIGDADFVSRATLSLTTTP